MLAIRRDDPEGQCVAAADRMHDYLQLLFWTADVLKVFNEYEAQGVHGASPITDLVGLFADAVAVQDNAIELAFGAPGLRIHLNSCFGQRAGGAALHFSRGIAGRLAELMEVSTMRDRSGLASWR